MKRKGLLFALGNKTLASTYNQLTERSRALASDARAFAYWTTGQKGGRFTNLAAMACKVFIQETIEGNHPEVTGSTYFTDATHRYSKWKSSGGMGEYAWLRTGKTKEAFEVRKGKIGKKSIAWVSVDPKATTPQIDFSGNYRGMVKVKDVVKWLEFGTTRMSARPLVSAAIQRFVTLNFPGMSDSLRSSFEDWIKNNNSKFHSRKEGTGDLSDTMGSYTTKNTDQDVAGSNPTQDFDDFKIKEVLVKGGMTSDSISTKRMNKKEDEMLLKVLRGSGASQEEINRIMEGMKNL